MSTRPKRSQPKSEPNAPEMKKQRRPPKAKASKANAGAEGTTDAKAKEENHHAGGAEHGKMLERGLIYFFYRPKVEVRS